MVVQVALAEAVAVVLETETTVAQAVLVASFFTTNS
jgi:hypothetical protein